MKLRGFTMIEILVVLVIIGVLATLGGASYIKSLSRGRDARKLEDMKTVQNGFEIYYSKKDGIYDPDAACATMFSDLSIFPSGKPSAPADGTFTFRCSSSDYCACASVENFQQGNSETNDCLKFSTDKTKTAFYCLQSVQ